MRFTAILVTLVTLGLACDNAPGQSTPTKKTGTGKTGKTPPAVTAGNYPGVAWIKFHDRPPFPAQGPFYWFEADPPVPEFVVSDAHAWSRVRAMLAGQRTAANLPARIDFTRSCAIVALQRVVLPVTASEQKALYEQRRYPTASRVAAAGYELQLSFGPARPPNMRIRVTRKAPKKRPGGTVLDGFLYHVRVVPRVHGTIHLPTRVVRLQGQKVIVDGLELTLTSASKKQVTVEVKNGSAKPLSFTTCSHIRPGSYFRVMAVEADGKPAHRGPQLADICVKHPHAAVVIPAGTTQSFAITLHGVKNPKRVWLDLPIPGRQGAFARSNALPIKP